MKKPVFWSEKAISEELGSKFFRMTWNEHGKCQVIDLAEIAAKERRAKSDWDASELVHLVLLKRRGHTMDDIEVILNRERSRVQTKWSKRSEWLSTITVPDEEEATACDEPEAPMEVAAAITGPDQPANAGASLDGELPPRVPTLQLHQIASAVCTVFKMGKNDFFSHRRAKHMCEARHIYFWVARNFTYYSFPMIGRHCGDRDHSTVKHGADKVSRQFPEFRGRIAKVLDVLEITNAAGKAA